MKKITIRVNENLKDDFYSLCTKRGVKPTNVISRYCRYVVKNKKEPMVDMYNRVLKYVNDNQTRMTIKIDEELAINFETICKDLSQTMSSAIRFFMDWCCSYENLPSNI